MSSSEDSSEHEQVKKPTTVPDILKQKKWVRDQVLIGKIYNAVMNDYIFTNADFDNVISAVTQGGSVSSKLFNISCTERVTRGYISTSGKLSYIVTFMFTNFVPNDDHVKKITKCYKDATNDERYYGWLNILMKKNHNFTDNQISYINSTPYLQMDKLFRNQDMNLERMKYCAKIVNLDEDNKLLIDEMKRLKGYESIPETHINEFIKSLNPGRFNNMDCGQFLKDLIKKSIIGDSTYNEIIASTKLSLRTRMDLISLFIEKRKPPEECIKWLSNSCGHCLDLELLLRLHTANIDITERMLNDVLGLREYCYYDVATKIDFSKVNINGKDLIRLKVKDGKNRKPSTNIKVRTIDLFELFNVIPSFETLKVMCKNAYIDSFDDFMSTYKIEPTKECLDLCATQGHKEMILKLICYKMNPDKDTFDNLVSGCSDSMDDDGRDAIELLIKNGFNITFDEIEKLISKKMCLTDLSRFNIPYDEKLYFACFKHNYFPEEYSNKFVIDPKILKLRDMCTKKIKIETLKTFMRKNNVKPDKYCVDNTYIYRNTQLQYHFKELHCDPTVICAIRTSNMYLNNKDAIEKIFKTLPITSEIMSQQFEHVNLNQLPL